MEVGISLCVSTKFLRPLFPLGAILNHRSADLGSGGLDSVPSLRTGNSLQGLH